MSRTIKDQYFVSWQGTEFFLNRPDRLCSRCSLSGVKRPGREAGHSLCPVPSYIGQCYLVLDFTDMAKLRTQRKGVLRYIRSTSRSGEDDFPYPSRPGLGPTQPPVQWVPILISGGKATERGANHPPLLAPKLTFWSRNYFFLILAHRIYKM